MAENQFLRARRPRRQRSEGFAKGFLGFVVVVALAEVELVSAFAKDVGADGQFGAAMFAGPSFHRVEEQRTGAEAALTIGNDEAVEFGARADFDEMVHADMRPADDAGRGRFRDKKSVLRTTFEFAKAFGNFGRRRGVTELAGEIGEARSVGRTGTADFHGGIGSGRHGFFLAGSER